MAFGNARNEHRSKGMQEPRSAADHSNTPGQTRRLKLIIGAASLAVLAGLVSAAQPGRSGVIVDELRIDLPEHRAQQAERLRADDLRSDTRVSSTMRLSQHSNGNRVDVTVTDGNDGRTVVARVNGEAVDADLIDDDGKRIAVRSPDGRVLAEFNVGNNIINLGDVIGFRGAQPEGREGNARIELNPGNNQPRMTIRPLNDLPIIVDGQPRVEQASQTPPVMLGIQMEEPTDALAAHFGLQPGSAIMVGAVADHLPAQLAGLKPFDIIVEIEGDREVTPRKLVQALSRKEAGDVIALTVIQGGERKPVIVELVKYDPTLLASTLPQTDWNREFDHEIEMRVAPEMFIQRLDNNGAIDLGELRDRMPQVPLFRENADEINELLRDQLRDLERQADQLRGNFEDEAAELRRETERLARELRNQLGEFDFGRDAEREERRARIDRDEANDRLDRLEQRFDRLERLLRERFERD
ncbi:MAG: PDZ domain-containing protein [Planctomycetota bacterium]